MESVYDPRAMIRRGLVQSINDSGPVQTVTVTTSSGQTYADIEVIQPYGLASVPPVDGCIALLFCVGGDPANMVAILTNPSARLGNQVQGEATLYNAKNASRVACRTGGLVEIAAGVETSITSPSVTVTAASSVALDTPGVNATGNLAVGTGVTGNFTTPTGNVVTVDGGITTNID